MRTWFRGRRPAAGRPGDLGTPAVVVVSADGHDGAPGAVARRAADEVAGRDDVVLLVRQGCHLCVEAEPVVAAAAARHGAGLAVVDVDAEQAVRERFTDHVPVLFVHGALVDYWRVDAGRLDAALSGRPVAPPAAL